MDGLLKLAKHNIVLVLEGDEVRVEAGDNRGWTVTKRSKPEQAIRVVLKALGINADVVVEDWDKHDS